MTPRLLLALLALAAAACRPVSPRPPSPVEPPPESSCDDAGRTLERLECRRDDGTPRWKTPAGASFAEACIVALRDGRNWNPHCIAKITGCSELDCAYRGVCCGGS